MEDDMDWIPPTEAEMKVIQAKRERADKISNLMGSYLLKGYKMLNETCPKCTTIFLRDKQDELYCVACMEVDADTEKDNPASSAEAARRQVAESQFASPGTVRRRPATRAASPREESRSPPAAAAAATAATATATATAAAASPVAVGPIDAEDAKALSAAAVAVRTKLSWAAAELESASSVESSLQLVSLIRTCADTLHALRHPATAATADIGRP